MGITSIRMMLKKKMKNMHFSMCEVTPTIILYLKSIIIQELELVNLYLLFCSNNIDLYIYRCAGTSDTPRIIMICHL